MADFWEWDARPISESAFLFMAIELTKDLVELKAQAEGAKPFQRQALYERLAEKDLSEFRKFDPPTRLAIGYYVAARRRVESLKEVA